MLKSFIKYFKESKEYRKKQMLAVALSLAGSVISAIMPFLIRSIIQDIQTGLFSRATLAEFIAVFLVLIASRCISFFRNSLGSRIKSIIGHIKRYDIISKILNANINRKKILDDSTINDRLMRDIYCYSQLLGTFPITIIDNSIKIVIAAIVLVNINVYLFFISLVLVPLAMFAINLTKEKMKKAWENQLRQWEGTTKIIKEILASRTDIKQMNSESRITSRFQEQNQKHFASETYINKISFLTMEIQNGLFSSLPMFCLLVGLALILLGKSDIGSTVAFYMYVNFLIVPFASFADVKVNNVQAGEEEKKVQEILDTLEFNSSDTHTDFKFSNITIKKASYQYSNGESVLFEKPLYFNNPGLYYVNTVSGFGKSTIFKLMTKLLSSEESNIQYDSLNVNSIPENVFFKQVTYLNGTPNFIQGTIIENITSFGRYDFDEKYLGLFFDANENVTGSRTLNIGMSESLSSGQLQRINLLRLFAKGGDQKLIVLDEAISGVQEEKEREILSLLRKNFSQSIIILVTHRKSSEALCDYKIEMV